MFEANSADIRLKQVALVSMLAAAVRQA